jgi:CubicO group peptidase (beta-lactamase class C family)
MAFILMSMCRVAGMDSRAKQADAVFSALVADREPGAAVLLIKDGRTVLERGYGVTDLLSGHQIDTRTNFRLASVTKQFTAASIMLLVRDGKLDYDDCLIGIVPDFPEYGRPFGRFLHDRIFAPLKMNRTVAYEPGRNKVPNRAFGHTKEAGVWRETDRSPT